MKVRILSLFTLVLLILSVATTALADIIIDTGDPTGSSVGLMNYTEFGLMFESLAGQFTLTEAYTITKVQGYMNNNGSGSLDAVIYGDSVSGPVTSKFTGNFTFSDGNYGWQGLAGLNWTLPAGTYWLAFEPRTGFNGNMLGGASNPLASYAFGTNYVSGDPITYHTYPVNTAVRIEGSIPSAVPEPSTYALLCISLGVVGFARKKMGKA